MSNENRTAVLPNGREIQARFDERSEFWTAWLAGTPDNEVSARELAPAIAEVLGLDGIYPDWLVPVASEIAGRKSADGLRFACACCKQFTLDELPSGTYLICPVCFWEDDGVQFRDHDYEGGANTVSLGQARANYLQYGASEARFRRNVRPPLPSEIA